MKEEIMNTFRKISLIFLFSTLLISFSSAVMSFDLIVPDTGQDLCYDWERTICDDWHMEGHVQVCDSTPYCPEEGEEFYGQDACYTINPPDLTDNGDGTVTDNLTGLIWEQQTEESEPKLYTYSDAVTYCDELTLGGNDDWRMPTRKEFSTILNFSRVSPALDMVYFPNYTGTTPNEVYYWTSSEHHDDPSQVWAILISFGLIESESTAVDPHKVRCVRGNSLPVSSYTDNGDGTVTDSVTGLMWEQKTDDGGSRDKDKTYTWKDALAYCENLVLGVGDHDDWRLPNTKEIERLVDIESSSPAVNTSCFSNTNNGLYWTGTSCTKCHYRKAFAIDFSDGELYYGNKYRNDVYYENYVRCVKNADASVTTTTTSPVASTTTTTVPSQPCPTEEIYGEGADEAQLLRSFRDNILSKTPEGKEMIRLYYQLSPAIVRAMEEDKKFKEEIKKIIDGILPMTEIR